MVPQRLYSSLITRLLKSEGVTISSLMHLYGDAWVVTDVRPGNYIHMSIPTLDHGKLDADHRNSGCYGRGYASIPTM